VRQDVTAARPPGAGPGGVSTAEPLVSLLQRCRRIAVAGLEDDERAPANVEAAKLLSFDLELHLIHPTADALLGLRCYPSLSAIPAPIDLVQVFPSAEADLETIARDAVEKSVAVFWYEGKELPAAVVERLGAAQVAVVVGHELAMEILALEE
jgi:predicted CoA-binding protein